jgi:hypothetical protein
MAPLYALVRGPDRAEGGGGEQPATLVALSWIYAMETRMIVQFLASLADGSCQVMGLWRCRSCSPRVASLSLSLGHVLVEQDDCALGCADV